MPKLKHTPGKYLELSVNARDLFFLFLDELRRHSFYRFPCERACVRAYVQ